MLLKYFDPLNSKSVFSEPEQALIRDVRAQYGVTVKETLFQPGERQNQLAVWVDTDGDEPFASELRTALETTGNPPRAFADELMRLYAHHFGIENIAKGVPPDDPTPGCWVAVYDFKRTVNGRAHAEGVKAIRKVLKKQFGMPPSHVISIEVPKIVACVEDRERYQAMKAQEDTIRAACYEAIKPFDRYDVITKADIGLDIVLWSKLDGDTRFHYAREIVANNAK